VNTQGDVANISQGIANDEDSEFGIGYAAARFDEIETSIGTAVAQGRRAYLARPWPFAGRQADNPAGRGLAPRSCRKTGTRRQCARPQAKPPQLKMRMGATHFLMKRLPKGRHRDGAARVGLQHDQGDEHHGRPTTDGRDEGVGGP
jgi:hypothetical protein